VAQGAESDEKKEEIEDAKERGVFCEEAIEFIAIC